MAQAPSVGRSVHYVMPDGQVRPATVVAHWGSSKVNLQVFTDGSNDRQNLRDLGEATDPVCPALIWRTSIELDEGDKPKSNTWHWPPRV